LCQPPPSRGNITQPRHPLSISLLFAVVPAITSLLAILHMSLSVEMTSMKSNKERDRAESGKIKATEVRG
jgi:hypothetical protein